MDAIQINRNAKVYSIDGLDFLLMLEEPDRLLVVLKDNINHKLSVGQYLVFRRYAYDYTDRPVVLSTAVELLEKTTYEGHDAVYVSLPRVENLRLPTWVASEIKFNGTYYDCTEDYDAYFDDTHRYLMVKDEDNFVINDWLYYYNNGREEYFIIEFSSNHNIFAQDIDFAENVLNSPFTIDVLTNGGAKIGSLEGISIPFTGMSNVVTSADTLTKTTIDACGYEYDINEYKYTYLPLSFSRRRIRFNAVTTNQAEGSFFDKVCYLINNGTFFVPNYNAFYYYQMDGSNKKCELWRDTWWEAFDGLNSRRPIREIYVNSGDSRCMFGIEDDYWAIPTLAISTDMYNLGIEEGQQNDYVDSIIEGVIPEIVDMERFKYSPVVMKNRQFELAKSITIDMHFRRRTSIMDIPGAAAENGSYPVYDNGWYINEDSANTIWWNGMGTTDAEGNFTNHDFYSFSPEAFADFYNESGKTADLLGYLGFTDEDVYYRKSKLSMSFVRLSFYTSKDPVTQKLLYYSTSFLDATSLFGRFMKQSMLKYDKYGEFETTPIVFFPDNSASARVDCEIHIENEFNNLASSEGFNLYLFGDDADLKDDGKDYRTIYLKVEFNHAGNGKTIPMVMWPKNGGSFREITVDSFINDLYIPVQIRYNNGRFVYSLPTAVNDNGNLRLIVYEPKLDYNEGQANAENYAPSEEYNPQVADIPVEVDNTPRGSWTVEGTAEYTGGICNGIVAPYTPVSDGEQIEIGGGDDGGHTQTSFVPKSDKRLYFGAYSVNTFYGRRFSLPVFLKYPNGRPTSSDNSAIYSIEGKLKVTSSNPSVIDISKDNYTALGWLYNACDRYTLPAVVHIPANKIKGVGSAVIKIELIGDPEVYDTCIVNVSNTNSEGVTTSSFGQNNLVYPWETYVKKGTFFDIWMHHWNLYKYEVSISDESGVIRRTDASGLEDSVGNTLREGTHSMSFEALKTGDYTITFEHPDYNGTGKAKVHIIDE